MSWEIKDLTGQRFSKLKVLKFAGKSKHNQSLWECECDCGNVSVILGHSLTTGNTTKCAKHPLNEWVDKGDYVELDISTKGNPNKFTKIDKEDLHRVLSRTPNRKWLYHDSAKGESYGKYVVDSDRKIRLHRFLLDVEKHLVVDHINGDTLDNRKSNLRVISRRDNNKNMKLNKNNTSGHKGVRPVDGKWVATIHANNVKYHLGYFYTKSEAIAAYTGAARVLGFTERHINGK